MRWLPVLLVGCGYDAYHTTLEISFPRQEIEVEEASLHAHRDGGAPCDDVPSCRARFTGALEQALTTLQEEGIDGASGEVRVRGGELDLVRRYVVPFDAAMLSRPDSVLRLVEIDQGGKPRPALALVLPGAEKLRPTVAVKGPHTHVRIPVEVPGSEEGEATRLGSTEVWTFSRGRQRVEIDLTTDGPTEPWAGTIPGFLESLAAEPIRRP